VALDGGVLEPEELTVRMRLLALETLLCAACTGSPLEAVSSPSASPDAPAGASIRPREPTDAPSRTACATRVLSVLVDAINARDVAAIGQVIGPGPEVGQTFQWVSMSTSSEAGPTLRGSAVNEVEYTPDGARRLLLQHAAKGERWTLGIIRGGAGPSWHGGVDAEVHFDRQLADGRTVKTAGKTALSCIASAIYVLSLGDE
jgi:hypothetical protein